MKIITQIVPKSAKKIVPSCAFLTKVANWVDFDGKQQKK